MLSILSVLAFANDTSAASTISVTSSGAQSINVRPDVNNNGVGASIGVDEITVNTTCRAGYNFSISTSVNDNNLYLNGSSTNNQSGKYFTPADGTTALSNATNTWGYYFNSSAPTTAPTASNIFQPVPTLSSTAATIKTPATTASTTDISDSFNIYYGVSASSNLTPGTYKMIPDSNNANTNGVITYYVTMDTSCDINTISYNANNGSGTISPQEVQNGDSVALADNAFTRSNHYFMGWSTNQNATTPEYRTNQTITPTSNMTLYAVWGDSTAQPLYNTVASLTRGNQTNDTNATTGLQTNPTKATSGVWTYNASTFGTASDASTSNAIYYYRGILDNVTGTYGSDGDSMDYPNYVKLGITCWRIVRTTGSGGVKMIYNGMYGNTTSGSCANATTAAQIRATSATTAGSTATFTSAFAGTSTVQSYSIVGVGYTRNNTYASTSATTATAYSTLFGTNSSYSGNSTNSTIKGNIETWFTNNLDSYASKLEASAGYCNDRTLYPNGSYGTSDRISDSTTIVPYGTSSMTFYHFGAYARNSYPAQRPTLTCPRATVDLYTTSSASNGNKQLSKPVALLTADEMSFAGSGNYAAYNGSGYSSNSYLCSGSVFWLLSPYSRVSGGDAYGYRLYLNGSIDNYSVRGTYGVRPAISLTSGTLATSGSGTAADPWVVEAPTTMQDFAAGTASTSCSTMSTGDTLTLVDSRDNQSYTVGKLADGKCWMLDNLALDLTNSTVLNGMNSTNTNASNTTLGYLKGASTGTTSDKYATAKVANWTSSYSYSAPLVNMTNKDVIPTDATSQAGGYKVGGYYNYCAASAGSYCYGNGTSQGTSSGNATESICPKGWRLPTGNTSGEYQALYSNSNYNTYANYRAALHLPLSGYFISGSPYDQGSGGRFWSSTRRFNRSMYSLYLDTSSIYPADEGDRHNGSSVRCVLGS